MIKKPKPSESNEIKEYVVQVCLFRVYYQVHVVCLAYIFFMTTANSEAVPGS